MCLGGKWSSLPGYSSGQELQCKKSSARNPLSLDEAWPQHRRAFKADMTGTKLKGSQGSHGRYYSCFMLSGKIWGKDQDPRLKVNRSPKSFCKGPQAKSIRWLSCSWFSCAGRHAHRMFWIKNLNCCHVSAASTQIKRSKDKIRVSKQQNSNLAVAKYCLHHTWKENQQQQTCLILCICFKG